MNSAEIAEALGIPAATSRRRLQAARRALQRWIADPQVDRRVLESTKTSLDEWARRLRGELERNGG
ncbi:MAG: hypothetical protein KC636_17945 [Myxococcales bacterium]|nr:hypothetical protein [Myxococcales bacterium]